MTEPVNQPATRWAELTGSTSGAEYAARFAALAAGGKDMHGEAAFCAGLVTPPARVLDAGCGTGRIAIRLAELGYHTVGVDLDDSMLAAARAARPDLRWLLADLATLELAEPPFDLIVVAGNVIPLLAPGTLRATVGRLSALLSAGGLLVSGFGLDAAHLPKRCPVTELADYDAAAKAAGLASLSRFATWDGAEYLNESSSYCVSVHYSRMERP